MFVPRVWCPSVLCQQCKSINDHAFRFCQTCGTRSPTTAPPPQAGVGEDDSMQAINDRITHLDNLLEATTYSKQKDTLKKDLCVFLLKLSPSKILSNALPGDLRKFLIFKENKGRTLLHTPHCNFRGMPGNRTCGCPKTMAAKSVDSLIGRLRAIFRDMERTGDWNPVTGTGNPASSPILKRHLKSVQIEQAAAEVTTKQATPLMFDKLIKLCRFLTYKISVAKDGILK